MSLRIAWATHDAALYACKNWHYSKSMPVSAVVKVGVWESGEFIGVVLYSRGANRNLAGSYGLTQTECCELTRIALNKHSSPVSRIMRLAHSFLIKSNPGLKLIISYADPMQGHVGAIYQADNWLYLGCTAPSASISVNGTVMHKKTFHSKYGCNRIAEIAELSGDKIEYVKQLPKLIYAKPICNIIKAELLPKAKPYPKRDKQAMTGDQPEQRQCNTDHHAPELRQL